LAKRKILIIDDNNDVVESVKMTLEETGGYEVRGETKAVNGLDVARQFKPDMILLDIIMPGIAGNEVARRLKDDPQTKTIPIAYFSVIVSQDEIKAKSGIIGGNRFIPKPSNLEDLVHSIEEVIGK